MMSRLYCFCCSWRMVGGEYVLDGLKISKLIRVRPLEILSDIASSMYHNKLIT